jgi:hypothetical protein
MPGIAKAGDPVPLHSGCVRPTIASLSRGSGTPTTADSATPGQLPGVADLAVRG